MEPEPALRQIAFELESDGAPTYRLQPFRRAAGVLAALPAGELARRIAEGTLADLRGIDSATGSAATASPRERMVP